MSQEKTGATQAPETTQETPEQKQAREAQEKVEAKLKRFMKTGTETPAEVAGEMQMEAEGKTAEIVGESEKLAGKAREAGADEIAQKAEGLGQEAEQAKNDLLSDESLGVPRSELGARPNVRIEDAQETPSPTPEQADLPPEQKVEMISKEKPDLTEELKQYWAEVFANQQELNKGEHSVVNPMNLNVGDVIVVNGGKIGNYQVKDYFRITSIDKNGPNNVDVGTESVDGQTRGVIMGGMSIDKNGPPIEVIKSPQETQSTPEQSGELLSKIKGFELSTHGTRALVDLYPEDSYVKSIKAINERIGTVKDLIGSIKSFNNRGQLSKEDRGQLATLLRKANGQTKYEFGGTTPENFNYDERVAPNLDHKIKNAEHAENSAEHDILTLERQRARILGEQLPNRDVPQFYSYDENSNDGIKAAESAQKLLPEDRAKLIDAISDYIAEAQRIKQQAGELGRDLKKEFELFKPEYSLASRKLHESMMELRRVSDDIESQFSIDLRNE